MANYFTNAGRDIVTNRVLGAGTEPKYMGWGTGAGAASAASTGLSTEKDVDLLAAGPNRTLGASSRVTTSVANDTYQVVATRTATGGGTVTNLGLFDAASAGNLFVITDAQSVLLASGDAIQGTFKWQLT